MDTTAQQIAQLVDGPVCVAWTDPRDVQPALIGAEGAHLARAIDKRKREFAAGRAAARAAMKGLGGASVEIPAGPDRAPIWPAGWRGSISHKDTFCAAMVTQSAMTLGLDVEEATDLDEILIPNICSQTEIAQIDGPKKARHAKLIFSAKEAAYKAQYPLSKEVFGFHHLHVALDTNAMQFSARFRKPAGPFGVGTTLLGRYCLVAGHFVTAVSIADLALP